MGIGPGTGSVPLEIELRDVLAVEDNRRAEQDFAGRDLDVLEPADCVLAVGQFALAEQVGGVDGEIAQVDRAPEDELLHGAVVDVLPHQAGQADAGDRDLVGLAGVAHGLGRAGQRHRRDAPDADQVGMGVDDVAASR